MEHDDEHEGHEDSSHAADGGGAIDGGTNDDDVDDNDDDDDNSDDDGGQSNGRSSRGLRTLINIQLVLIGVLLGIASTKIDGAHIQRLFGNSGTSPPPARARSAAQTRILDEDDERLPAGWSRLRDPSTGRTFYHHEQTRVSRWDLPDDQSSAAGDGGDGEDSSGNADEDDEDDEDNEDDEEEEPLPGDWQRFVDAGSGRPYFFSPATRETTWTDPRRPRLPAGWEEHVHAESGKYYYYHAETSTSTWEDPRA